MRIRVDEEEVTGGTSLQNKISGQAGAASAGRWAAESLWIDARINRGGGWVIDRYGEEWWMPALEIYRFLQHAPEGINPVSDKTAFMHSDRSKCVKVPFGGNESIYSYLLLFGKAMMVFFWQLCVTPARWQDGLEPNLGLLQTWILSERPLNPELASQSHCRQL